MQCDNPNTPAYLVCGDKETFTGEDFRYYHKFYRITSNGNPVVIPESWITAISCNWSKIIKKKDILHQPEKIIGDDYNFVFINELRNYKIIANIEDPNNNVYSGRHEISCTFIHTPIPCNYAHAEILIKHEIFKDEDIKASFSESYTHEAWEKQTAFLKKATAKPYKKLRKDFRVDMIKLISRLPSENTSFLQFCAFLRMINWNNFNQTL